MPDNAIIELLEYLTEDGRNPFREWLLSLRDAPMRARVRVRLNRVRLGNFGDSQGVGGGVSELRLPLGPGYRVDYGRRGAVLVILLCGGDQGTQARDIPRRQGYWAAYQRGE